MFASAFAFWLRRDRSAFAVWLRRGAGSVPGRRAASPRQAPQSYWRTRGTVQLPPSAPASLAPVGSAAWSVDVHRQRPPPQL